MADIRKRTGKRGTTYQVRYPSSTTKSGYAFKSFNTLKEARYFLESGETQQNHTGLDTTIFTVSDAIDKWLHICETEGSNDREPVTEYTLKIYNYHTRFMKRYPSPIPFPTVITFSVLHSWSSNKASSPPISSSSMIAILKTPPTPMCKGSVQASIIICRFFRASPSLGSPRRLRFCHWRYHIPIMLIGPKGLRSAEIPDV